MSILNDLVLSYEIAGADLFLALHNEARVIFWMLALMSTVWSLILLASQRAHDGFLTHFGRHLLFYGFFGGLFLELYPRTIGAIPGLLQEAGSQTLGADTFLNPDQVFTAGFGLAMRLIAANSNFFIFGDLGLPIRLLGALVMMVAFTLMALKAAQLLIEQHIAVLGLGVFLLAFTGGRWTWSIGEGLIRYAVHLGLRLFLLVAIFDVGKSLIDQWTAALGTPFGFIDFRTWIQVIFGSVVFAHLAWTIPERVANHLSQRISFPSPHTP